MADRAHAPALLIRRTATLVVATMVIALLPRVAHAHNTWTGGYRKFPWKAGTTRTITTLPGECPHCPGSQSSSAWKAIDIGDMDYETVYSISPGVVDVYDPDGGAAGRFLRILDDDGTYIVYEHLSSASVTSGRVFAGQPIAVSGCTGRCSGPHLHLQRQSGPSFSSTALDIWPISGHGGSGDALAKKAYPSDNAGIGTSSGGWVSGPIRNAYNALNGYDGVGISADLGETWSPCRNDAIDGTWWRYWCSSGGFSGSLQTFAYRGKQRALMVADGSSTAYMLFRGALGAYTEVWNGYDWVHWIGYPTTNRWNYTDDYWRQDFRNGRIVYRASTCTEWMYIGGTLKTTYGFCD